MTRATIVRLCGSAALLVAALGVGSAMHLPALAANDYAHFVTPMVSATCASSTPCLVETNTSTGAGIRGVSSSGNGADGQTKFKSTSAKNGVSGVLGQDQSTSGVFDFGVMGTSTNGTGVEGTSTNGNGVRAFSVNQSALFVENTGTQDGIQSVALSNDGTNTSTQNNSSIFGHGRSGLWGHDDSTDGGTLNYGVTGSSTNGTGVYGTSTNYVAMNAFGGGGNTESTLDDPTLSLVGSTHDVYLLAACSNPSDNPCTGSQSVMYVDFIGNVNTRGGFTANGSVDIGGDYYQNGTCVAGCAPIKGGSGRSVTRYVPTASVPSVEDYGEAQLVNGQSRVALSSDFANVIDQRASYLVFVTPEGDTNGLYITQKTNAGFTVRENRGGRSTVAFEYRIVARPFGENGARLPMVDRSSLRGLIRRH
ncbi:MAG TPA: hypothetical protein VKT51_03475 [Candidatus Eremiobacteraceae bacterium]|nr:hypothetical protein [Candidatus Eremiobacteraceae bacterium]